MVLWFILGDFFHRGLKVKLRFEFGLNLPILTALKHCIWVGLALLIKRRCYCDSLVLSFIRNLWSHFLLDFVLMILSYHQLWPLIFLILIDPSILTLTFLVLNWLIEIIKVFSLARILFIHLVPWWVAPRLTWWLLLSGLLLPGSGTVLVIVAMLVVAIWLVLLPVVVTTSIITMSVATVGAFWFGWFLIRVAVAPVPIRSVVSLPLWAIMSISVTVRIFIIVVLVLLITVMMSVVLPLVFWMLATGSATVSIILTAILLLLFPWFIVSSSTVVLPVVYVVVKLSLVLVISFSLIHSKIIWICLGY